MRLYNITFDAHDPVALATFWAAVLERPVVEWANENFSALDRTGSAPAWLFIRVPECKGSQVIAVPVEARRQLAALGHEDADLACIGDDDWVERLGPRRSM